MLNKNYITIYFLFFLPFKIYASDNFNIISQCNNEYETSCDVLRLNGVKKNIILAGVRSPIIKKISDDVFYVLSSCGSPCVGHYFFDRNKEDYTNELIVFDINSGCIIESDSAGKKYMLKECFLIIEEL